MGYKLIWMYQVCDVLHAKGCLKSPMAQLGNQKIFGANPNKQLVRSIFKERYGVDQYTDFDINGKADVQLDLTKPLPVMYNQMYETVVDSGTLEHIFDQAAAFKHFYSMCEVGGHIIHIQGVINLWNHSLFSYFPKTFLSIAKVNKYKVVFETYINTFRNGSVVVGHRLQDAENLAYVIAMKKTNTTFHYPEDIG